MIAYSNKTEETVQSMMPGKTVYADSYELLQCNYMHMQCTCNAPIMQIQCSCYTPAMPKQISMIFGIKMEKGEKVRGNEAEQ